jgi:hypothetical protein
VVKHDWMRRPTSGDGMTMGDDRGQDSCYGSIGRCHPHYSSQVAEQGELLDQLRERVTLA